MPAGIYRKPRMLIHEFWQAMKDGVGDSGRPLISFNKTTCRITVQIETETQPNRTETQNVRFNKALAEVFGLSEYHADKELSTGQTSASTGPAPKLHSYHRDNVGRPMPFKRGCLIVTLVSKKRSSADIPW